jgi:DNA-binding NarL/FixJ family response regulator
MEEHHGPHHVEKLKIMLVEDEVIIRLYLKQILEQMDCVIVAEADSGETAIHLANSTHPDAIIMDIRLKGAMDGIEAVQEIEKNNAIPVIFTSAYQYKDMVDRLNIPNVLGYINKPVAERELAGFLGQLQ